MTNYFHGDSVIIPFSSVSNIWNINTDEITVYLNRSNSCYRFKNDKAAKFISQYLAWLDAQSPKPRSL